MHLHNVRHLIYLCDKIKLDGRHRNTLLALKILLSYEKIKFIRTKCVIRVFLVIYYKYKYLLCTEVLENLQMRTLLNMQYL